MTNTSRRLGLLMVLGLVACGQSTSTLTGVDGISSRRGDDGNVPPPPGPNTPPPGDTGITFLSPAAGAPSLAETSVSFYAIQGMRRSAEIWFHAPPGTPDSTRLLRLRVRARTQIVRPDGRWLAPGDSILITLRVIDPVTMATAFSPAGLQFLGDEAADLTMWYLEANHDLNGDGVVDARDRALEGLLGVYRQEAVGSPWQRVPGILVDPRNDQIEGPLSGFSNYVIAY